MRDLWQGLRKRDHFEKTSGQPFGRLVSILILTVSSVDLLQCSSSNERLKRTSKFLISFPSQNKPFRYEQKHVQFDQPEESDESSSESSESDSESESSDGDELLDRNDAQSGLNVGQPDDSGCSNNAKYHLRARRE